MERGGGGGVEFDIPPVPENIYLYKSIKYMKNNNDNNSKNKKRRGRGQSTKKEKKKEEN